MAHTRIDGGKEELRNGGIKEMNLENFLECEHTLRPAPPRSLYHYCKATSLKYLVHRDSDIWCTHCNHLNDPEECWTGMRMFLEHLKRKNKLPTSVYQLLAFNVRENSFWNKICAREGHSRIMPFSFSLSEVADEHWMWENYANNCGYRLEFDGDAVEQNAGRVQSVLSRIAPTNRMSLSLWPCFYEESDDVEIKQLFDALHEDIRPCLDGLIRDTANQSLGISLLSAMASVAPLFKTAKWSREKEWRLIMVREDFDRVHFVNHRARSYLSSSFGGIRGLMKSIRACPHGDVEWESRYCDYEINDGFRNTTPEFL